MQSSDLPRGEYTRSELERNQNIIKVYLSGGGEQYQLPPPLLSVDDGMSDSANDTHKERAE